MSPTEKFTDKFIDLIMQTDPSIINVEVIVTRNITTQRRDTTTKARPTEAPPLPADEPEAQAAPLAPPEPEGPTEAEEGRVRVLPDPAKHTKGMRYADEVIAQAKCLIARGMRPVEVARVTGISQQHISSLKNDKSRRAVAAASDPRGSV